MEKKSNFFEYDFESVYGNPVHVQLCDNVDEGVGYRYYCSGITTSIQLKWEMSRPVFHPLQNAKDIRALDMMQRSDCPYTYTGFMVKLTNSLERDTPWTPCPQDREPLARFLAKSFGEGMTGYIDHAKMRELNEGEPRLDLESKEMWEISRQWGSRKEPGVYKIFDSSYVVDLKSFLGSFELGYSTALWARFTEYNCQKVLDYLSEKRAAHVHFAEHLGIIR